MKEKSKAKRNSRIRLYIGLFLIILAAVTSVATPSGGMLRSLLRPGPICTLADQILAANRDEPVGGCPAGDGIDTILLHDDVMLTEQLPVITSTIIIEGADHKIDGRGEFLIFSVDQGEFEIRDLTIIGGNGQNGGAIHLRNGSTLILERTVVMNSVADKGGAIYTEDSKLQIVDAELENNSASTAGGAVYARSSELDLLESRIIGNSASNSGGGIYSRDSAIQLNDSVIESNQKPRHGGGIYLRGGDLKVMESTLRDNSATSGGGIYIERGSATVLQSTISSNRANQRGGGIYTNAKLVIERSSLYQNRASDGGGIYSYYRGDLQITNTTLSGNRADSAGGALYQSSSGPSRLTHVTIKGNAAQYGAGIYAETDGIELVNSILASNRRGDCVADLAINVHNIIYDGSCTPKFSGDAVLFPAADTAEYFALGKTSNAIGAAHRNYCPATDQRGVERPQGVYCDIGAYEVEVDY